MSTWAVVAFATIFVVVDGLILWAVFHTFASIFRNLSARYPAFEPAPDAVRKRYQSFRFDLMNCGWSIHVAVDDHALHLTPARHVRWCGGKPVSIPWDQVRVKKIRRWFGDAVVGSTTMTAPAWCLRLAASEGGAHRRQGDTEISEIANRGE